MEFSYRKGSGEKVEQCQESFKIIFIYISYL